MIHTLGIIAGICFKSDPNCHKSLYDRTNSFLDNGNTVDLHIVALHSANMGNFLVIEDGISGEFEINVKNSTYNNICHLHVDKASMIEFGTKDKRFKLIHITYETDVCNIMPHLDKIIKNVGVVNDMIFYKK